MSEPAPTKITRLDELPRDIPPPRDGWPALEARLRESVAVRDGETAGGDATGAEPGGAPGRSSGPVASRPWRTRRTVAWVGALAAAVAAVAAGIFVDRLILQTEHPNAH